MKKSPCKEGFIINPDTGRCIKINGPTYKKLVRFGVLVAPIETLPTEITFQVMMKIPPDELHNMCKTNKKHLAVCKDAEFKRLYFKKWYKGPVKGVSYKKYINGEIMKKLYGIPKGTIFADKVKILKRIK